MSEPAMPVELSRAVIAESDRQVQWLARTMTSWPNFREHIALAALGMAVATCDSFGIDVEGWLANLRKHEPRPAALTPPRGS
jgi:hypothetical protein